MAKPDSIGTTRSIEALSPQEKSEAKQLFISFLEDHLGIQFRGFQNAFGHGDDLVLFAGSRGSTLAVPVSVMHEPRETARRIIQEKIAASEQSFHRSESDSDDDLAHACRRWWQSTSRAARAVRESTIGQAIASRDGAGATHA